MVFRPFYNPDQDTGQEDGQYRNAASPNRRTLGAPLLERCRISVANFRERGFQLRDIGLMRGLCSAALLLELLLTIPKICDPARVLGLGLLDRPFGFIEFYPARPGRLALWRRLRR
ncbi:hypothetical protein HZF05_11125 [Sphingomonas sp. CGMCC 1.13654]|uniref:Uncharacterized protein n=1 Tax=Sphingomonas chungangi TaxID=2683589 RepID=A0A838L929_9SPHN|nr:hypothetical protein [Sphingomonas chungangi]MVW57681.1 hypothetical protein [Sphingomonas chungangi]